MVGERELRDAIRELVRYEHLVAEGAGAAGRRGGGRRAGALARSRTTAVVVSGANIDMDRLAAIIGSAD